ncbi:MAG: hypothetical protein L0Z55_02530 [Planctomycetes bacterium]|nr:hypothetical protein [Planctomycetota bacterium]
MRLPVRILAVSAVALLCCLSACVSKDASAANVDAAFPASEVHAYAVVPSLDALLEHIAGVANSFQPGSLHPTQMKAMLGAMFDDPELSFLQTNKPIVWTLFKPAGPANLAEPPMSLFLPVNDPKALTPLLAQQGLLCRVSDGVLVIAGDSAVLERAAKLCSAYRDVIAKHSWQHDVAFKLDIDSLNDTYGAMLRDGVTSLVSLMDQPFAGHGAAGSPTDALAKFLRMELKGFLGLLNQTKSIGMSVSLAADSIRFDYELAAKPGTILADFLATPPKDAGTLRGFAASNAAISSYFRFNAPAVAKATTALFAAMKADPEFKSIASDAEKAFGPLFKAYAGEFAMNMRSAKDGGFAMDAAYTVTGAEEALKGTEAMVKLFGKEGAAGKLYSEAGTPMNASFERNVREEDGVAVHRYEMSMDTESMPPEQAAFFEQMPQSYECAVAGSILVMANDPRALCALIAKAKQPARGAALPLRAAAEFGNDKDCYADFDFAEFLKSVLTMVPVGSAAAIAERIGPSEPIVWAASIADGATKGSVKVPLAPFVALSRVAQNGFAPEGSQGAGLHTMPPRRR